MHTEYTDMKTKFTILYDSTRQLNRHRKHTKSNRDRKTFSAEKKKNGKQIRFIRISGHTGIPGNERADHEALDAIVSTTYSNVNSSTGSDTKNVINSHVNNKWRSSPNVKNTFTTATPISHISERVCQTLGPNPQDTRNLIVFLKKKSELYSLI